MKAKASAYDALDHVERMISRAKRHDLHVEVVSKFGALREEGVPTAKAARQALIAFDL